MTDQQAHTPLLVFRLADQRYGLHITDVVEVAAMVALTEVPGGPDTVLGMANRRGQAFPMLDLRRILGYPAAPVNAETLFIVVQHNGRLAGLVVDEVSQVEYVPVDRMQAASGMGPLVQQIAEVSGRWVSILALPPLLPDPPTDVSETVQAEEENTPHERQS